MTRILDCLSRIISCKGLTSYCIKNIRRGIVYQKLCIAERDVILMKRVSVSSVGVKCTYIVSHGRLSLTQKKTGFRGRNYRTATRFVGISRMKFGLIVIRGIHNWWFAYVSPEFHEKHPVSLIYHASVCQENMRIMSESHSAKNINNVNIGHYRYIWLI